jgi:hypothetical protein
MDGRDIPANQRQLMCLIERIKNLEKKVERMEAARRPRRHSRDELRMVDGVEMGKGDFVRSDHHAGSGDWSAWDNAEVVDPLPGA